LIRQPKASVPPLHIVASTLTNEHNALAAISVSKSYLGNLII